MATISKAFKTGDKVTVQMPMDHHHGREGVVESVNGRTNAVKFDDNARAYYEDDELKLDEAFEEDEEPEYPGLDVAGALEEVTQKTDFEIELETAYKWTSRACAVFQLAAMTDDFATQANLIDWADDLEHEALEHAALVRDRGATVAQCQDAMDAYRSQIVAKADLTAEGRKHVASHNFAIPSEKKYPIHDISHARNALARVAQHGTSEEQAKVKAAVYRKYPSLKPVEKQPNSSDVHVPAMLGEEQEHEGEYIDPDTNTQMYPPLDNLEVEVLKDAFSTADQSDDNVWDGLYSLQDLVEGMDWELEHTTTNPDDAKRAAIEVLTEDPNHYKLLRQQVDGSDDVLTKDTQQTEDDPFAGEGFNVDLGSGTCREPGFLGMDLYPYDYGTLVHDLHLGLPFPDGSVGKIRLCNSLHTMDELKDDPKALLSEIHRVLMPGGQFVYEGPNEIYNYPEWSEDYPGFVLEDHEDSNPIQKDSYGDGPVKQTFTRIATPDPATANDAEPRIGVAQFDQLPADALMAVDALGYYWSDATSSGRGNRMMGYPSQGALLEKDEEKNQLAFKFVGKDQMAEMSDEQNNVEAQPMTPAEEDVDEAFHPNPVNPLPPKKPGKHVGKRTKKARTKKGGPGSGPHPGGGEHLNALNHTPSPSRTAENTRHAVQVEHDRRENEKKQQRIREQAQRNVQQYHRQAAHDSARMQVHQSVSKSLETERIIPILKADNEKQIVYGVVLEPNVIDAQDDFMSPEDIETTAHNYMATSRIVGASHTRPIENAFPIESYIAPQDFELNGQYGNQPVKKGSWVLGVKVLDPEEWDRIKSGEYTGFSVGGVGERLQT